VYTVNKKRIIRLHQGLNKPVQASIGLPQTTGNKAF
jgi:hypothetical protein